MKKSIYIFGFGLLFAAGIGFGQTNSYPSQLVVFSNAKEKQERQLARELHVPLPAEVNDFFKSAHQGDYLVLSNTVDRLGRQLFAGYASFTNGQPAWLPFWQPMTEVETAYEIFAQGGTKYPMAFGNGIIQSIPAGSIYFGGSDAGRMLVTALCADHAGGKPFCTLTQNALSDDSGLYDAFMDPAHGYAYFFGNYLWKLDITGNLPVPVCAPTNTGGSSYAAIDPAAGYAYITRNTVLNRYRLGAGTNAVTSAGSLVLGAGSTIGSVEVDDSDPDPSKHNAYVFCRVAGNPTRVAKVALGTFVEGAYTSLDAGETNLGSTLVDATNQGVYLFCDEGGGRHQCGHREDQNDARHEPARAHRRRQCGRDG